MDEELKTLIKERYAALPDDVKRTLSTLPIAEIMQGIAQSNGLHIDQAGTLYTETVLVMLGAEKIGAFKVNLMRQLGVTAPIADKIVGEINEKVFLAIRGSLQAMNQAQEAIESEIGSVDVVEGDRNQILDEIENPTPANHPITTNQAKESVAHDFIGGKLTETVNLPAQKAEIPKTVPTRQEPPKPRYSADPYREPIN